MLDLPLPSILLKSLNATFCSEESFHGDTKYGIREPLPPEAGNCHGQDGWSAVEGEEIISDPGSFVPEPKKRGTSH